MTDNDNDNNPAHHDPDRREVFKIGAAGVSAIAATGALGGALLRSPMPGILPGPSSRIKIGLTAAFPKGSKKLFVDEQIFVMHDDNGLCAMSTVCTHLGCAVSVLADGGFICPCHGSIYDDAGNVLAGPAPKALDWYRVRVLPGDRVEVDKSKLVPADQRTKIT